MNRLGDTAVSLSRLEPAVVILIAPILAFPIQRPTWTAAALALLLVIWALRWIGTGQPGTPSLLDLAMLVLVATIPVAVWSSAFPALTLPKLTGLILGLAAYRALVNAVHGLRRLEMGLALFLLLGLGLAAVGLLGGQWANKLPALGPYLERIPRLVQGLPGADKGIHPNELGGTIVLFLPVSLAAVGGWSSGRRGSVWLVRGAVLLVSLFLAAILLASQSRSAWWGLAAGLMVMAWLRWRWLRWLILVGLLFAVVALMALGPQELEALLLGTQTGRQAVVFDAASLGERVDQWQRALDAIAKFPATGVGLGAFRRVAYLFGPDPLLTPGGDIGHAHNEFLQVGADLGIAGLVAYLALVLGTAWCCWRIAQKAGRPYAWLGLGIIGSLVAFHVYGLTDAIALGAKPGIAFWLLLALAAALWNIERAHSALEDHDPKSSVPA